MSQEPARKPGRPKSNKKTKASRQTSSVDPAWFPSWGAATRKSNLDALFLEPTGEQNYADIFGDLVLKKHIPAARRTAGDFLADLIESGSTEAVQSVFASIVKLKKSAEAGVPQVATLYRAYDRFIELAGREPNPRELKEFALENFMGLPRKEQRKEWGRLREAAGLPGEKKAKPAPRKRGT